MTKQTPSELSFWYLRDHDFFWEISNSDLKSLCVLTGFKKAKKGDIIHFSDDTPRIYFMKKGAMKLVSSNDEGNEVIHDILRKGDIFGQLVQEKQTENLDQYAIALTDEIVICSFLADDFEALMIRKPDLAMKYTKFMLFKYKRFANNYNNLFFKSAKARLAHFIVDWADKEGVKKGDEILLYNYLTQNDLAQIICSTRQTVASIIGEFEHESLLQYARKELLIHKIESLKKIAEM